MDAILSTRAVAMTAKMVAVGYAASLPITEQRSLFEFETPVPRPGDRDLLVRVQAVSVNPVDVKSRMRRPGTQTRPVIFGLDAAGDRPTDPRRRPNVHTGRPSVL